MKPSTQIFSFKRLKQLMQYHLIIDRRSSLLLISGYCIGIVLVLFLGQIMGNQYLYWENTSYFNTFMFFYFAGGVLYAANSFKWLRTKESRFSYLMIPATSFEKFILELLFRVVTFIVLVPVLFWLLANIEGTIFHMFAPRFINFQFSFAQLLEQSPIANKFQFQDFWLSANLILSVFLVPFAGSTFFKKNPLAKTVLSLALISGILFIYGILLFKIFDLKNHHADNILFISTKEQATVFFGIALFIENIVALLIAFYNVKEKEV